MITKEMTNPNDYIDSSLARNGQSFARKIISNLKIHLQVSNYCFKNVGIYFKIYDDDALLSKGHSNGEPGKFQINWASIPNMAQSNSVGSSPMKYFLAPDEKLFYIIYSMY